MTNRSRQQRRARGFRSPLPKNQRREPRIDGNPGDMTGVPFYAWPVSWATAHINADACAKAFYERPAHWGVVRMRKVTRRALTRRTLQLCMDCAQRFVEARMQARYLDGQRREKLAERGITTYAEQDAAAAVAGRRTR